MWDNKGFTWASPLCLAYFVLWKMEWFSENENRSMLEIFMYEVEIDESSIQEEYAKIPSQQTIGSKVLQMKRRG